MGSKLEAGGIAGNRYWAEILMAKCQTSCWIKIPGDAVWPSKSPPNKDFREQQNQPEFQLLRLITFSRVELQKRLLKKKRSLDNSLHPSFSKLLSETILNLPFLVSKLA